MKNYWYILFVLLSTSSCQQSQSLTPLEYVKWVENDVNGLLVQQETETTVYTLQYKPIEYLVAVQERKQQLSKDVFDRVKSQMDGLQYYTLRVRSKEEKLAWLDRESLSEEDYLENVNHLSFGLQHELTLVDGQDSLSCLLFHWEQTNNIALTCTFLLGFDQPEQSEVSSKKLVLEDDQLETGRIELTIRKEDLTKKPKMHLIQ